MVVEGQILKMITEMNRPVDYFLNISGHLIHLNQIFGKKINITQTAYQCVICNKNEKPMRMGFCKKCFFESPYASETILKPELSTAHLGIEERDLEVEKQIQLQPHIVYLSYTGGIKVGVTRESQIPTRWIDQGANFALPIARTENRYQAGMIEVATKQFLPDKTHWRKMLQETGNSSTDEIKNLLTQTAQETKNYIPKEFIGFFIENQEVTNITFPYTPLEKINSINLNKTPNYSGILTGIKGQYLQFNDSSVMNIRNHEGYVIQLEILNL